MASIFRVQNLISPRHGLGPQRVDAVLLIATTVEPAQLESALVLKQTVKPGSVLVHKLMLTVWLSLFPLVAAVPLEVLPEGLS